MPSISNATPASNCDGDGDSFTRRDQEEREEQGICRAAVVAFCFRSVFVRAGRIIARLIHFTDSHPFYTLTAATHLDSSCQKSPELTLFVPIQSLPRTLVIRSVLISFISTFFSKILKGLCPF
jgi:hypothetical protein